MYLKLPDVLKKDRTTPSTAAQHQKNTDNSRNLAPEKRRRVKKQVENNLFEPALQWSAVLLNRTKARQNVPLTHVENQTGI